jgi:Thioredoxin like C-terminal domain
MALLLGMRNLLSRARLFVGVLRSDSAALHFTSCGTGASKLTCEATLNHWGLSGSWNVNAESAVLRAVPGKIVFRFHSRGLHLVLAPAKDAKPIRFVVRLDGAAPGENCGVDTAPDGSGEIRELRLYQLIRQRGPIVDRTFEIEFLDLGVQALDFTFG